MNPISRLFALFVVAIGLAAPAAAVQTVVIDDNGNIVDTSFSGPGTLALDVFWVNTDPVWLEVRPEDIDGGIITLSHAGLHPNALGLPGVPWTDYHIEIEPLTPGAPAPEFVPGSEFVSADGGGQSNVLVLPDQIWMDFDPAETSGVFVNVDILGATPNTPFTLHIFPTTREPVIPEPVTATLGLISIAGVAFATRRRRERC